MTRVENIKVREGFPAEEILLESEACDCDLIVMGTHVKGVLDHTVIGSVARRVLRGASRPVLVVPLPKPEKQPVQKEEDI